MVRDRGGVEDRQLQTLEDKGRSGLGWGLGAGFGH